MSNCDKIFQQIQALEAKKKGLSDALAPLSQVDEEPDPVNRFVFRGKDGQNYEASFDELFRQITQDPLATKAFAEMAAQNRLRPVGAEGQFENFSQLVDRMGLDRAADLGALLTRFTGDWAEVNPNDFYRTIAISDPEQFKARVAQAFDEAGIAINENRLAQMISTNVAPFLDIVSKQDKLRVLAVVTRNNVVSKVQGLLEQIRQTGVAPTVEAKRAFMRDYDTAIYAHRSERIASRRAGQLLQNLQRVMDEDAGATDSLFRVTGEEAKAEADQLAKDIIATRPEELVQEDSFIKRVIEAADKGAAGEPELVELIDTAKREGIDHADKGLDKGWKRTWKRNARAGYKDSILFNPRTQLVSNYLSQKIVYLTEGYRRLTGQNGWDLYGNRLKDQQLALIGDPDALAKAQGKPVYINPLATGFFRDALKSQLDGSRIAVEAGLKANAVIKQTWQESLQKHFMEADTPFAGNVDNFIAKGQMTIDEQYAAAQEVLNEPWDKGRFFFQLRDKLHVALKFHINQKIFETTGQKLPIYSALQMMSAVDQRMGLRVFMTQRANDLIMEQAAKFPDRTLKEWSAAVDQQLTEQIYRADPSPDQIRAARAQFDMEEPRLGPDGAVEGFTDDEVAAYIASEKLGYPVLATPEQQKARDISVALRMQQRQTQGLPGVIDNAVSRARQGETGDVMVSFWRSPFNQQLWDLTLAGSPMSGIYKVAEASGKMVQGKLTPELAAEAQSSLIVGVTMMAMFLSLKKDGNIVGNGPVEPNARKQWMERLNAEGKVPNSILGIPFNMGGIPVLNSLFLMADAADVIEQGGVSSFDQQLVFEGLSQLVAGQIMRTPGFRQVQMLYDAFANGSSNAFEKLARWGAFMANGQLNPVSGGERLAEWATGTQWQNLTRPEAQNSSSERFTMDQLPPDHPLNSIQDKVRSWVYMSNPGVAHWMGLGVKETTWLGRALRRPEGIFRGEWPIGVPGIWEFNGGEYRVERKLEELGMLNPPSQLMLQKASDGTPMTTEAAEEFNDHLGKVKPEVPFSRDARHGGSVVWRGPETTIVRNGQEVSGGRVMVDLTRLMDEATQGRTVREAMDYVLNSRQWKRWDADPQYTSDPKVRDMTKELRRNQPGPYLLQKVKAYYANLAEDQLKASGTPAALQLVQDRQQLRRDGEGIRDEQMKLLEMSR